MLLVLLCWYKLCMSVSRRRSGPWPCRWCWPSPRTRAAPPWRPGFPKVRKYIKTNKLNKQKHNNTNVCIVVRWLFDKRITHTHTSPRTGVAPHSRPGFQTELQSVHKQQATTVCINITCNNKQQQFVLKQHATINPATKQQTTYNPSTKRIQTTNNYSLC